MSADGRGRILLYGGIAGLLMLTLAPLLLSGGGGAFASLLEKCRELLAQCMLAVRAAGAPLFWLPISLLAGGVAYACIDRVRVSRRLDRLLAFHSIRRLSPDEPIGNLAREFRLEEQVHALVGLAPNPAFTLGVLRPRIYIAEELQRSLTAVELRAVFRHEVCHLRRRDPLRFAVLRFLSKTFPWLPLLRVWVEELMEDAEFVADDFAAAQDGGVDPLDVASALVVLGRANQLPLAGAASIGGFRLLDRRVRRLAGAPAAASSRFPLRPALLSSTALAIVWAFSLLGPPSVHALSTRHARETCPHGVHAGPHEHCPRCDRPRPATHACRS